MVRDTFTARAAHWSAAHRKTAVLGWLAFVLVAFMIGGAAGTVTLKHEDMGNGESRAAERVLAQQFPRERAAEQVLIQSRNGGLLGSEYRAAVDELVARLSRMPAVAQIESPLEPGNEGQLSKDGTAALRDVPDHRRSRHGEGPRRPCAGGDRRRAARPPQAVRRRVRRRERQQGDHASASATTSSRPR